MRRFLSALGTAGLLLLTCAPDAGARGFGMARGGFAYGGARGGFAYGGARTGFDYGAYGGARTGFDYGARGGFAYGDAYRGGAFNPYGAAYGGARGGTYVGPRGTTVQAGRVGGVAEGPFGFHAAGAEGARVTTPAGRTFATGEAGRVGVGPYGGVHAAGARSTVASGPYGAFGTAYRGGVAVGPAGGVSAWGYGHATRYVSPATLQSRAAYVRTSIAYPYFNAGWYRLHPGAWVAPRWAANLWLAPAWPAVAVFCGITAPAANYDYGGTVVIQDDNVYYDGRPVATAEEYATQAQQYADAGRQAQPTPAGEWQPLGVFGLIQGDETVAQQIFQLAVNSAGVIRGNYYDALADTTLPVYGSVDKTSQRAAWSIGDKKTIVYETGLNNLTQPQTAVLVHFGTDRTEQMALVRLPEPKDGSQVGAGAGATGGQ